MNFLRTPFVTSDTVCLECIACYDEMHKIQLQFHFRFVTYNATQCLKPSVTP